MRVLIVTALSALIGSDDFLSLLGGDEIDPELFHVQLPLDDLVPGMKLSLLHIIAIKWLCTLSTSPDVHSIQSSIWSSLIGHGVRAGADLQVKNDLGQTPLIEILTRSSCAQWDTAIYRWTEFLAQAGVDLQKYGEIEHNHMRMQNWQNLGFMGERHIVGLTFGSAPSQWRLWYQHPGDIYAGIFWEMIEHPERAIPGAWVDDADESFYFYDADEPANFFDAMWSRGWSGDVGVKERH